MNEPREVDELFNEHSPLAFSKRIAGLIDEELEVEFDEEIEAILAASNL